MTLSLILYHNSYTCPNKHSKLPKLLAKVKGLDMINVMSKVVVVVNCGAGQKQSFQAFGERRSNQQNQSGGNMVYCMADGIQQPTNNSDSWPKPRCDY